MDSAIAWLAGLLEGEGAFTVSGHRQPNIKVGMTDEDVVRRAADILGSRNVAHRMDSRGFKDIFITQIAGQRAANWMTVLYPMMGTRRQAQIYRVFEVCEQPLVGHLTSTS